MVAAVRVKGRVAAAVAVVSFLAIGLYGRVAKVLEKATVLVSDDGLAWIRRTACSLTACARWIWIAPAVRSLLLAVGPGRGDSAAVAFLLSPCCCCWGIRLCTGGRSSHQEGVVGEALSLIHI